MKYFSILLSLMFFLPTLAMTPQEEYYLKHYRAPKSITVPLKIAGWFGYKIDTIARHYKCRALTVFFLPNYIIKPHLDRIHGAEIINSAIAAQSRPLFFVPKKYAYADDKTWVIAEKVKLVDRPFTKNHIEQLCTIAKLTKFIDLHEDNVGQTADGRGVILDTGGEGFGSKKSDLIYGYEIMRQYLSMDPEAEMYLNNVINDLKQWLHEELEKKTVL